MIAAAGERLAALAQPVYSRLGAETLPFALQGGLAASSGMLVNQTRQALEAACPRLAWTESRYSPLQGALILAADLHAGRDERLRFVERLE